VFAKKLKKNKGKTQIKCQNVIKKKEKEKEEENNFKAQKKKTKKKNVKQ
jgi:hypothetical protein